MKLVQIWMGENENVITGFNFCVHSHLFAVNVKIKACQFLACYKSLNIKSIQLESSCKLYLDGAWGFQDALFYFLVLGFDKVPLWGIVLISAGSAVVCALIVWFFVCPRMKKKIERK